MTTIDEYISRLTHSQIKEIIIQRDEMLKKLETKTSAPNEIKKDCERKARFQVWLMEKHGWGPHNFDVAMRALCRMADDFSDSEHLIVQKRVEDEVEHYKVMAMGAELVREQFNELKKELFNMKLLPNKGHACDGFCLGTCLEGTRLKKQIDELKKEIQRLEDGTAQSVGWVGGDKSLGMGKEK